MHEPLLKPGVEPAAFIQSLPINPSNLPPIDLEPDGEPPVAHRSSSWPPRDTADQPAGTFRRARIPTLDGGTLTMRVGFLTIPYSVTETVEEVNDSSVLRADYFKTTSQGTTTSKGRDLHPSLYLNLLWVLIACGYMVPWTSIGSLISYFAAEYGPGFYVKLYCCFYLPGWPMSELQSRFDEGFDRQIGSSRAFFLRVTIGLALQGALLVLFPSMHAIAGTTDREETILLVAMVLMGIGSWICHGTACQLCGLFPPSSTAYLQTGFRCPEIFAIVMVAMLDLEGNASILHLEIFYYATAIIVLIGFIAWLKLVASPPAQRYFRIKDDNFVAESMVDRLSQFSVSGDATSTTESQAAVASSIYLARVSLFLNIFSSVFTAAFFVYVPTTPGGLHNMSLVLYFVRLFSDLAGRPLSAIIEGYFGRCVSTMKGLVVWVLCRMSLAAAFFCYIYPNSPIPRSDAFVLIVTAVFSALSGYLCILSYEFAAASQSTKLGQSRACALMNSTFQFACFTSVIAGVLVSNSGVFGHPN